jgi:hypothetical protein
MFNDDNCQTNGEVHFFNSIKDRIGIIFDVGCRTVNLFIFAAKFIILTQLTSSLKIYKDATLTFNPIDLISPFLLGH